MVAAGALSCRQTLTVFCSSTMAPTCAPNERADVFAKSSSTWTSCGVRRKNRRAACCWQPDFDVEPEQEAPHPSVLEEFFYTWRGLRRGDVR